MNKLALRAADITGNMKFLILCVFLVQLWNICESNQNASYILVSERTGIRKVELDGTPSAVISGQQYVYAMAADFDDDLLFFSDVTSQTIRRCRLNGTDLVTIVSSVTVKGLVADTANKRIVWTDSSRAVIESSDYNGAAGTQLVTTGLGSPTSMILHKGHRHLYWTDYNKKTITKAGFDGTVHLEKSWSVDRLPLALGVDEVNSQLYWSDGSAGAIFRSDLELNNEQTVISQVSQIYGIAVDGTYLYWSRLYFDKNLDRADKTNGAGRTTIIANLNFPTTVLVVPDPNSRHPTLTGNPTFSLAKSSSSSDTVLTCTIPPAVENGVKYLVTWMSEPNIVAITEITGTNATLKWSDVDKTKIVKSMKCTYKAQFLAGGGTSGERSSDTFTPKIEVLTRSLTVTEAREDGEIRIRTGAPPAFFGGENRITLGMKLQRKNEKVPQALFRAKNGRTNSRVEVTDTNWDEVHVFKVKATKDGRLDGTQQRQAVVYVMTEPREDPTAQSSSVVTPVNETVQINTRNTDTRSRMCRAVTDPRMGTFDGSYYDNQYAGEFKLYGHRFEGYQINLMFSKCSVGGTCNCAVAVRSRDTVLVFSRCTRVTDSARSQRNSPLHIYFLTMDNTSGGMRVERVHGYHRVTLPHGGRLDVRNNWLGFLNVYYHAAVQDRDLIDPLTEGLCGWYDGDNSNDLMFRNRTFVTGGRSRWRHGRQVNEFNEEWRVRPANNESLFAGVRATNSQEQGTIYCVVGEIDNAEIQDPTRINETCGTEHELMVVTRPVSGTDVTEYYLQNFAFQSEPDTPIIEPTRRRRKRSVNGDGAFNPFVPYVIDTDHTPGDATWPTPSGRTEQEATDYCTNKINGHDGLQQCALVLNRTFETEIRNCVSDIGLTDQLEWVEGTIDALTAECESALSMLEDAIDDQGQSVPLPAGVNATSLRNSICPRNCSGNGTCNQGTCVCDSGYVGSDCSMRRGDPPTLYFLHNSGLCDLRFRTCSSAIVFGGKFQNTDQLTCHLQHYEFGAELPSDDTGTISVAGLFVKFDQISCPVPNSRPYVVRVSNDGARPAPDRLLYIPYNSTCYSCTVGADITRPTCVRKTDSCVIEGQCYEDGATNPAQSCQMCNYAISDSLWTLAEGCGGLDPAYIAVIVVVVVVVAVVVGVPATVLVVKFCGRGADVKPNPDDPVTKYARSQVSLNSVGFEMNDQTPRVRRTTPVEKVLPLY